MGNELTLHWSRQASLSYGVSIVLTCRPLLLEGCQLHVHAAVDVEYTVEKSVFLALQLPLKQNATSCEL